MARPLRFYLVTLLILGCLSAEAKTRILALGDSLTEGYGLAKEEAFPALLEKKLKAKGKDVEVINAGISGATSASGPTRLRWHLKNKPAVLILALGANDGLRGLDVKQTEKNLTDTVATAKSHGIKVVLVGMKVPPNYGEAYTKSFEEMYPRIATKLDVKLVPFLLEGVAGVRMLNLSDGIHPNAKGHEKLAVTVEKYVSEIL